MRKDIKHVFGMLTMTGVFAAAAILAPARPLRPLLVPSVNEQHDTFASMATPSVDLRPVTLHPIDLSAAPGDDSSPLLKEHGLNLLKSKHNTSLLIQPSMTMARPPPDMDLDEDRRGRRQGMGINGLRDGGDMRDTLTEKSSWGWLADDVFSSDRNSLLTDDFAPANSRDSR